MSGAMPVQIGASEAPSKVTEPIITASSGTVPAPGLSAASPDSGRRSPTTRSRVSNGDDAREEVEVDREGLAAGDPGLDPVERHRHEGERRVDERGDRDGLGVVAVRRHQLHARRTRRSRRRPASGRAARGRRAAPAVRPRAAFPAIQPTVRPIARHGLKALKTSPNRTLTGSEGEPEDHVDEGRREVGGRALRAAQPGVDDHAQQEHADRAAQRSRPAGCRAARPMPPGQRPPALALEPRLGPKHGERDERDDQHHRGRPAEQPLRDGQVGPADEPVGEERHEGSTTRRATSGSRPASSATWLSISKAPSASARNWKRAGLPGSGVRVMS